MVRRSVPASSRWTAKAWRCGATGLLIPHCDRTSRQVRLTERGDRSVKALTRKQPRARAGTLPIIPEQLEQSRRQHDIAVFAALTLLDSDDHTLAVDGRRCEADGFGDPQTSCVADGQSHAVFQVFDGCQKAGHFLLAQHNRQLVSPTAGRNVVFDCPASLEGDGVEKAQGTIGVRSSSAWRTAGSLKRCSVSGVSA